MLTQKRIYCYLSTLILLTSLVFVFSSTLIRASEPPFEGAISITTPTLPTSELEQTSTANITADNSIKMPGAYHVEYLLHWNKYKVKVKATRDLKIDDKGQATLQQSASTLLARIFQESNFQLSSKSCALSANNYRYERTVFGKKKQYRIEFNNDSNQYIEYNNEQKKEHSFKSTLYDELSYQEALRCELKNAVDIKAGKEFEYLVRTKGKNKPYQFKVAGFEKIPSKLGELETIKLERLRSTSADEEPRETFIWFSKKHDYLIVKLQQVDGDDSYGLEIEAVK